MSNALLFLTHMWAPELEREFSVLSSIPGIEPWILTDRRNPDLSPLVSRYPRCHVFGSELLDDLPYSTIGTGNFRGHAHFPLLDFFIGHRGFEYYWLVEYDVRYTGRWEQFFARFEDCSADLITEHIRRHAEEPGWLAWEPFGHPQHKVPLCERLRSFNVIYRISRRALTFLDRELRTGWYGHHEVLLVSVLYRNGFALLDPGGDGEFVPEGRRNEVYSSDSSPNGSLIGPGTVRYRPWNCRPGHLPNKLYHPVKPASNIDGFSELNETFLRPEE